ncbi:MAG: GNAT family N-acetyltransferase [Candidatus Eremiobacteraeota bacterium]|nr:GNAT family N-acetyltransferase [Candidatus Eremiobacteraeota bacterium]
MADIYVNEGYALRSQRGWLEDVAMRATQGQIFVALDRNRILGSAMLAKPPSPLAELSGPGEGDVRLVTVARFARGQGVGAKLMAAVIDAARADGLKALVLWTQASMESAQRLYERLGFVRHPVLDRATNVRTFLGYRLELD